MNRQEKRKGMTMVEIIIVLVIIAIIAVLGFAGGKMVIDKAKITAVQNDYHTIELAVKQMLLEHPEYITKKSTDVGFSTNCADEINRYLPQDFKASGTTTVLIAKTDPWTKNYRLLFSPDDANNHFFKVYAISGGANAKFDATSTKVEKDDLILVVRLVDGDVKSKYFGFDADNTAGNLITNMEP